MKPSHILLLTTACLLAAPFAAAQAEAAQAEAAQAEREKKRTGKLRRALETMADLHSLAFRTSHKVKTAHQAQIRGLGGGAAKTVETRGVLANDILSISLGDGEDQVVFHNRRMIARDSDNSWSLRRNRLANGGDLPYVLDPGLLFSSLREMNPKVVHTEVGTWENKPIEIYTVTIKGENARGLLWSGVIPDGSKGGSGNFVIFVAGGAGGRLVGGQKPDIEVDLAFYIDPATSLIRRITGRSYSKSQGPVAFKRVVIAGAGRFRRDEDEEEEDEEEEEPEQPGFKEGLPLRSKKKTKAMTVTHLDLRFSEHGKAEVPKLNARARRLLHLPEGR